MFYDDVFEMLRQMNLCYESVTVYDISCLWLIMLFMYLMMK